MKTGYIMIYFDVIFPVQLLEFIKSVNFGSNLKKKNCIKIKIIYHLKIVFL